MSIRAEIIWLLVILGVAAFLRIVSIDTVPPGISHDEAMYGLDSRDVVRLGVHPIYFERNNGGREPLFIYLGALSMAIVGQGPLAMRIVSILVTLATLVVGHLLFRRMFNVRVALFADAWLAINFWDLVLSRNSFRAVTLPLVLTGALLFLWIGLSERRRWAWPVGGVVFGLVQYTYFADRAAPAIIVLLVAYLLLFKRDWLRESWRGLLVYLAVSVLVFAPLGVYYAEHPQIFLSRFEQVSGVGGEDPAAPESPLVNVVDALGMFSFRGDYLWGRNIANLPVFDLLGAAFFYLGLALALWRLRQPAYGFLLIWIFVMILPTALSTSAPHYLRAVGLLPAIFALPGIGLDWALTRGSGLLAGRWRNTVARAWVVSGVLLLWLIGTAGVVYGQYFYQWAPRPEVYYGFHTEMNNIAKWLNTVPDDPVVALSSRYYQHPSFLLLLNRPYDVRWTNAAQTLVFPKTSKDTIYAIPWSARPDNLSRFFPASAIVKEEPGPADTTSFVAYGLTPQQVQQITAPLLDSKEPVDIARTVKLLQRNSGERVQAGSRLPLELVWQVEQRPDEALDLAWFVHLIDRDGQRWGIGDANEYPNLEWRPGDVAVSEFAVKVRPDTPPGEYRLDVGLYDRRTGERLSNENGGNVIFGRIKVTAPEPPAPPATQLNATFGDSITLVGYDLGPATCQAGTCTRGLRLVWKTDKKLDAAYTVFVHALDSSGAIQAQDDSPPANYRQPTDLWDVGELIEDQRTLTAPESAQTLELGLYLPATGARLPVAGGATVTIPLKPR